MVISNAAVGGLLTLGEPLPSRRRRRRRQSALQICYCAFAGTRRQQRESCTSRPGVAWWRRRPLGAARGDGGVVDVQLDQQLVSIHGD